MIPCQELNAKRRIRVENSCEKHHISKQMLNYISTKLPKVPLHPWAENWIHLSHKRKLWIEEPESKFRKKGMQRTHMKRTKVQKHERCKMAWEWGTNEYFYLPYVIILWCPSWKLPEDIGNNETHIPDLKRVILTWKSWFPLS